MKYIFCALCAILLFACRKETKMQQTEIPYGEWLAASASGDSVKVTAPFWVMEGYSWCEGQHGLLKIEWYYDSLK